MKADPFAQLRLLDLQALDSGLDRLAHRRRTLPELAEMARLDALVAGSRDDVVRAETEAGDLARETKKFEDEIALVRTRKARNDERMQSGAVTQPKQLEDLQHENVSLVRRQGELEDRELEVMEKAEAVQEVLDRLLAERQERLGAREGAAAARDAAWAEIDAEIARSTAERASVAAELPADLLALYEKIRAESGVGAGAIARGRCGGCRLDLMGNEIAAIRAAAPDEVLRHEECTRIMVRTAESGL
ncbi:MAG TPA: C4-type zinc ribbon domain-containing protein [Mycobacteriales bacterium]|nr:C4-type zinc ribbon domain-containing protein [Mycobacteriales bacterium]